jgi:hypothetical protein
MPAGVTPISSDVREYVNGAESHESYPILDGRFTFGLADGRRVVFDGRLDLHDQNGTMTVDGVDISDSLWADGGDSASLAFLGLDDVDLDDALLACIGCGPGSLPKAE